MLQHFSKNKNIICGVDEAGRGCIAGPVVAAAVVLPKKFTHPLLNDSKQLTEKQRNFLQPIIIENAIAFGVGIIDNNIIDEINILQATFSAMHQAIDKINLPINDLIIDGNRFRRYKNITHHCIIKGDATYIEIAAASILAKTYRDKLMEKMHQQFPMYNWQQNKGYPTIQHRKAIAQFGSCKYHRKTFNLLGNSHLF